LPIDDDDADMPPWLERFLWRQRQTRLAISAGVGVVAGVLTSIWGSWIYAPAVGWDAMALLFTATVWFGIWPMSQHVTARRATREDNSRATSDLLTLLAAVASLIAVAFLLVRAHHSTGIDKGLLAGLGLLTVAVSWTTVHTIFTLRYALLYYTEPVGGVDFKGYLPSYRDFGYLAFTVGMTFQVADTDLNTPGMRSTALRHALLSYLFGSVILATAINLVAGLG
jgi:uncharacterized membrane protein